MAAQQAAVPATATGGSTKHVPGPTLAVRTPMQPVTNNPEPNAVNPAATILATAATTKAATPVLYFGQHTSQVAAQTAAATAPLPVNTIQNTTDPGQAVPPAPFALSAQPEVVGGFSLQQQEGPVFAANEPGTYAAGSQDPCCIRQGCCHCKRYTDTGSAAAAARSSGSRRGTDAGTLTQKTDQALAQQPSSPAGHRAGHSSCTW